MSKLEANINIKDFEEFKVSHDILCEMLQDKNINVGIRLKYIHEFNKKIEKELEDLNKFSEEDLRLAEELLFNGFTKKDFQLNDKYSATLYSTNALEMSVVNELMYEFYKKVWEAWW